MSDTLETLKALHAELYADMTLSSWELEKAKTRIAKLESTIAELERRMDGMSSRLHTHTRSGAIELP